MLDCIKSRRAVTRYRSVQKLPHHHHLLEGNGICACLDPVYVHAGGQPGCVKFHGVLPFSSLLIQERRDFSAKQVEHLKCHVSWRGRGYCRVQRVVGRSIWLHPPAACLAASGRASPPKGKPRRASPPKGSAFKAADAKIAKPRRASPILV